MAVRIQLRRDTALNWSQNNPILRPGEVGIETDTLKFKIGPAVVSPAIGTAWNSISGYANVTPSSLSNSLTNYILAADQGKAGGPAELDANGDLLVPENEIILWNKDLYDYTTKIVATQPTADRTITLPDRSGTVITTGDTATVTNTMLAGSIANNKLANSSITINGFSIPLGGEAAYSTDNIQEGGTNKYFSNELAQDAVAQALANGTHTNISVSYDDANNAISLTGAQTYSDENAVDAVATALNNGTHTNISISYDDANNAISFTAAPGYTNEEARDAVAGLITASTHSGISVAYTDDGSNAGELSFTNTDKGSSQNIFKNIVVGATTVVADSNNDTLTIVGSNGVGALANATNDVIEIYNTGVTSLTGTANEVEVDTSTGAVIVGLPNNVTISGNLTLSNAPTQASHAATKAYVDNTTAGINFHAPAHVATTTNLAAVYNNGTNGVGATLTADTSRAWNTLDGHTSFNVGDRILVKNQTDATQNGMYTLTQLTAPWILTRATDADNSPVGELAYGDFVFVQNGGQAGYGFIVNTTGTITIGSTAINYVQFNAGQVVVAGNGLTEPTAGTLAIDTAVTVDLSTAQTLTNKTITGTFTGNLTGNADTVTNGVYTTGTYSNPSWITALGWSKITGTPTTISGYGITDGVSTGGSYSNPSWITSLAASKVGLGNVENTALSTWAGSSNLTTLGTVTTGTWNATTIAATRGGTGITTYATGDILYASAANTLSKLAAGTNGQILTLASGVPTWAAAPITLPSQTGNSGKYLTTDGTSASWATIPVTAAATKTTLGTVYAFTQQYDGYEDYNTVPHDNTALGNESLYSIYNGRRNVALGIKAAYSAFNALSNIAIGYKTLYSLSNMAHNIAIGESAAYSTNAFGNIAIGGTSLFANTTGEYNTVVGYQAMYSANGSNNIVLGYGANPSSDSASNEISLGNGSITRLRIPGLGIDWTTAPITRGSITITANTATTVDTNALNAFTSAEYVLSLKQGSKIRTSKVIVQTDGTNVDMTEFAITETGGTMSGVVVSATASAGNALLQVTVTDAATTNVTVKFSEIRL